MKKIALLLLVVVALAATGGVHAAGSQSVCQFTAHVVISPGDTLTPAQGTFTTNGETGSITCQGAVTGTGTIGYAGTAGTGPTSAIGGDSCALGSGSGTFSLTIGSVARSGSFDFLLVAAGGGFDSSDHSYSGLFQFMPDAGEDCATVPVTGATVTGQALLNY